MASRTSPTQRSLELLRQTWPLVEVVERWQSQSRRRQDLFGIFDILAVGPSGTLAVQVTTGDHLADRARKVAESPNLGHVREASWAIQIHGWRKNAAGVWVCRTLDIS